MSNPNPFKTTMVKMKLAPGMSPSMSVAGFEVVADDKGVVEMPAHLVATMKDHGLTEYQEPKAKAA